jgi:diketogulonate reductase-like aldo/keto reductase
MQTTLNNGISMPLLGLGVYDMHAQEAINATRFAIETGYRLIDTASMYENEKEIGLAIRDCQLARNELFITTKVNNADQGFESTLKAYTESLKKLQLDYVDLYLVHWPLKSTRKATWLALEKLYNDGLVKAIGVANYLEPFLDEMRNYSSIIPVVNQVEFSPYLYLESLLNRCKSNSIQLQAYSPLLRGLKFLDSKLVSISQKYTKTPAQIIIRWALQLGVSTIPKSSNPARIKENFEVFDFQISEEDILKMNGFNENLRIIDNPIEML